VTAIASLALLFSLCFASLGDPSSSTVQRSGSWIEKLMLWRHSEALQLEVRA